MLLYTLELYSTGAKRQRARSTVNFYSCKLQRCTVECLTDTIKQGMLYSGAKVCRGGCGIAIVGVYRDKSRYLAFAATYRDNILFPR